MSTTYQTQYRLEGNKRFYENERGAVRIYRTGNLAYNDKILVSAGGAYWGEKTPRANPGSDYSLRGDEKVYLNGREMEGYAWMHFRPGETQRILYLNFNNDSQWEQNETFQIWANPGNTAWGRSFQRDWGDGRGFVDGENYMETPSKNHRVSIEILNDDERIPVSTYSLTDLGEAGNTEEGGVTKWRINRTGDTWGIGKVRFQTYEEKGLTLAGHPVERADAGKDYVAKDEILTFAPGETYKIVEVQTIDDDDYEPNNESFKGKISTVNAGDKISGYNYDAVSIFDDDKPEVVGGSVDATNNGAGNSVVNGSNNTIINNIDNSITNITDNSITNVDNSVTNNIDNSVTIIDNSVNNEFTDNSSTTNLVNSGNTSIHASMTIIDNSQTFTLTALTSNTNQGMVRLRDESGSHQDLLRPFDTKENGTSQEDYLDGARKSSNKEFFEGGAGDDVLMGRQGGDVLSGGEGNDLVRAGHGRDVITGGVGGDTLFGGFGHNIFTGEKDGESDTLSFKSDQHLWNWLYGKSGNNADGSKLDVIHSLDAIDKIQIEGVETSRLSFGTVNNFAGATGSYSGVGIYADGFLEAIYTGGDLSASELKSMTVGVDV